jgi:hypothetical protein
MYYLACTSTRKPRDHRGWTHYVNGLVRGNILTGNRLYVFLWNIRVIPVVYQQPMDIFWNPWIVCILTHFDIYIVHMCRSHEHMDFSIHRYFMLLNWKTPPNYSVRLLVVSENPTSHYRLIWFRWCPSYGFVWKQDSANIGFELLMNWCKTFWNPTIHHN